MIVLLHILIAIEAGLIAASMFSILCPPRRRR